MRPSAWALIVPSLVLLGVGCGSNEPTPLSVDDAWTRPTPPGSEVAAFYLAIDNGTEDDDQLLSASSPRCETTELHRSEVVDDLMQMGPATADDLKVEAKSVVMFEPTGLHVMCVGLDEPIVDGDRIELTLEFAKAGQLVTTVTTDEP